MGMPGFYDLFTEHNNNIVQHKKNQHKTTTKQTTKKPKENHQTKQKNCTTTIHQLGLSKHSRGWGLE